MPDDLDLMQLASGGQTLARLDNTDYRAVHVVLAWPDGGVPSLYCSYRDWNDMPVARLVEQERQITELAETVTRQAAESLKQFHRAIAAETRIAELERAIADWAAAPPQIAPPGTDARLPSKHAPIPASGGTEKRVACDHCSKRIWPDQLDKHVAEKHAAQPRQFVEDLGWRCAASGPPRAISAVDPTRRKQRQIAYGMAPLLERERGR